jgi:hypothetical protein
MRRRERRDSGQNDLFKGRLDQIVDMNRPLMKLARTIDWDFLDTSFGAVYSDGPGQPRLPVPGHTLAIVFGLTIFSRQLIDFIRASA